MFSLAASASRKASGTNVSRPPQARRIPSKQSHYGIPQPASQENRNEEEVQHGKPANRRQNDASPQGNQPRMAVFPRSLHADTNSQSQSRKAGQRPQHKRGRQTNAQDAENFGNHRRRTVHPPSNPKRQQKKRQNDRQAKPYILPRSLPTPAGSIAEFWKQRVRRHPKGRCRRQRQQQGSQASSPINFTQKPKHKPQKIPAVENLDKPCFAALAKADQSAFAVGRNCTHTGVGASTFKPAASSLPLAKSMRKRTME